MIERVIKLMTSTIETIYLKPGYCEINLKPMKQSTNLHHFDISCCAHDAAEVPFHFTNEQSPE